MRGESWMDIPNDRQKGLSYVELGKKYHMDPGQQNGTLSHRINRSTLLHHQSQQNLTPTSSRWTNGWRKHSIRQCEYLKNCRNRVLKESTA